MLRFRNRSYRAAVPQLWLNGNDLTPQDVVIYHLSNSTWTVLPTTLVKSEGGRSYYTALSPGFGRFAITGDIRKSAVPLVMEQETPQGTLMTIGGDISNR